MKTRGLVWLSIALIIVGIIVWLMGDYEWYKYIISVGTWYALIYVGIALILIGTIIWAIISRKAKLI